MLKKLLPSIFFILSVSASNKIDTVTNGAVKLINSICNQKKDNVRFELVKKFKDIPLNKINLKTSCYTYKSDGYKIFEGNWVYYSLEEHYSLPHYVLKKISEANDCKVISSLKECFLVKCSGDIKNRTRYSFELVYDSLLRFKKMQEYSLCVSIISLICNTESSDAREALYELFEGLLGDSCDIKLATRVKEFGYKYSTYYPKSWGDDSPNQFGRFSQKDHFYKRTLLRYIVECLYKCPKHRIDSLLKCLELLLNKNMIDLNEKLLSNPTDKREYTLLSLIVENMCFDNYSLREPSNFLLELFKKVSFSSVDVNETAVKRGDESYTIPAFIIYKIACCTESFVAISVYLNLLSKLNLNEIDLKQNNIILGSKKYTLLDFINDRIKSMVPGKRKVLKKLSMVFISKKCKTTAIKEILEELLNIECLQDIQEKNKKIEALKDIKCLHNFVRTKESIGCLQTKEEGLSNLKSVLICEKQSVLNLQNTIPTKKAMANFNKMKSDCFKKSWLYSSVVSAMMSFGFNYIVYTGKESFSGESVIKPFSAGFLAASISSKLASKFYKRYDKKELFAGVGLSSMVGFAVAELIFCNKKNISTKIEFVRNVINRNIKKDVITKKILKYSKGAA